MEIEKIIPRLRHIRDKFAQICIMSQQVDPKATPDELNTYMGRRSELFNRILEDQEILEEESCGWQKYLAGNTVVNSILKDIRQLMHSIVESDCGILSIFNDKLSRIKNELSSLPVMAKAVVAYAGQKNV